MQDLRHQRAAEALEDFLGDPLDPANVVSFKGAVELDERDEFPEDFCRLLRQWEFQHYMIPASEGGKLETFMEAHLLFRVVSRRDLTAAIALGQIYLGSVHVWVGGTGEQKRKVAEIIKAGKSLAFALTEREHGSDVLAGQAEAVAGEGGYVLSGEKWLINNGTRSDALTVFVKTDARGGPRGFSLLLVEKGLLAPSSFTHVPRVKTHGIRGADISGIRFDQAGVAPEALIGAPGAGLEISLKGLMVTRTLCASFSLGAADTALRTALGFALSRRLYNDTVFAIPHARQTLVEAFADLLICDCVTAAAVRGLHVAPEQFSVWSAVVKYFVPTTVENMIRNCAVVLGARNYLREGHDWGIFQKVVRDNAVVGLFDGSTVVNLNAIALQLRHLFEHRAKAVRDGEEFGARLSSIFTLGAGLPEFDPSQLSLSNRGRDDVLQSLEVALGRLRALEGDPRVEAATLEAIVGLAGDVLGEVEALGDVLRRLAAKPGHVLGKDPELFELSKKYCVLHAAAACLQMWLHNRESSNDFFARGEWLALCLNRLLLHFDPRRSAVGQKFTAGTADELVRLYREGQLFSVIPLRLARTECDLTEPILTQQRP